MQKYERTLYHLVPGEELKLSSKEDAIVFFFPVRDFFPQYDALRKIFMEDLKHD